MVKYNFMASGLEVRIFGKIEDISRQEWEGVFPNVLENYDFFRTLDNSEFPQFSFFYIMVYDRTRPVGATSCFLTDYPMDMAMDGVFRKAADMIKRFAPRAFSPRVLICGLPMGQGRIGVCGDAGAVINAITAGMERLAREHKAGIIGFKDFNSGYDRHFKDLLDQGFFRIETLPSTDMRISFNDFEQYLGSLSSVSRSGLKRKFKKLDGKTKIDLEIAEKPDDSALVQIYGLYLQTMARQDISFEKLGPDFFKNIAENMPGKSKFFLWKMDSRIIAFAYCLTAGDHFIDYYLGFDYSLAYDYNLYFVRFRDILNWCIENKIRTYEMGPTSYEPKRRLGFDFIRLYIYARHRNKLINPLLKLFGNAIKPENFHPVFKEMERAGAL